MPRPTLTRRRSSDDGGPRLAGSVRSAAWAVEEKVVWAGADAARAAADGARYPFERLAWAIERRLIWPLQDATASWSRAVRAAAASGVAAAALAAGAAGALTAAPGDPAPDPAPAAELTAAQTAAVPSAASAPTPAAPAVVEGPILKGATPTFEDASKDAANTAAAADTPGTADSEPAAKPAADPVAGQKEALRVAERFAGAFVLYEIGQDSPQVRKVFAETASPELAKALRERPPRQPAGVEVPKARVLNVVPGPSHGDRLTVSASLLRVGSTSELRLDLRRTDEGWRITDVRG